MQGSAVPAETDGPCFSENNNEISPEILYRNEKENKPDCGLVRNITGYVEVARLGYDVDNVEKMSGALNASTGTDSGAAIQTNHKNYRITFDASRSVVTSSENRPINISAIPLIVAV